MPEIRNIIFDLGGVLLNIDYRLTEKAFVALGLAHFGELYTQHHASEIFQQIETGRITPSDFIARLQAQSAKPLTEQQITEAWNAMLLDWPADRFALLRQLKEHYHIYLLSNTNALHLEAFGRHMRDQFAISSLDELFHKVYYSHLMGLRKPDAAAFERVLTENNLDVAVTLFIDDTAENILGAQKAGLHTILLRPPLTVTGLFENGQLKTEWMEDADQTGK